jgi:hypothetical protein
MAGWSSTLNVEGDRDLLGLQGPGRVPPKEIG